MREGLRGLESRITREVDAWHLKRLGELMQVTVKSQWHLKDCDSKEVVQNINFNNNNLVMEVSANLSPHISHCLLCRMNLYFADESP